MAAFYLSIPCPFDDAYAIVVEDNGRVAYAYLLFYEDIVSDVWLYNSTATPAGSFLNTDEMPPLNPADYIKKDTLMIPISDVSQVYCEWDESEDEVIEAAIMLHGKFVAELRHGDKPGWSVFAAKDGPLALVY
ncbi:hypothetical protein IDJ77_09525 [Mucilaginibacter sp. ZT4R22]|uniref:Uncharacterized protein n=1 Tax=Mucilaginibacter pankratovii TaxID=2772110 RepID=A0ABR7WP35_9SPHI|nr:hypothetical protein [Mucilaginibacter pankratovii]MBD1364047.1 hypothetical protein [Mucilaginibacter pankratovii]